MSPQTGILSFDFHNADDELAGLLIEKPDAIDLANNSWSLNLTATNCEQMAAYNVLGGPSFDAVINGSINGQPVRRIPIVFAAGNARNDGVCGMSTAVGFPNYRSVLGPGTAKNVITVGAIDADSSRMTEFSGWGPTRGGGLKPDIVGPGCRSLGDGEQGILSAVPARGIGRMCGTSMAAPAVAGVVALMIEKFEKTGVPRKDVYPSTYKALLIHAAKDLGRPGPDFEFGYGQVKLAPTLRLIDDDAVQQQELDTEGETQSGDILVPQGASEVKVSLAWDDPPTSVLADEMLSNDLDLVLISPSGTQHLPLVANAVPGKETDPAQPAVDRINVVEQARVESPEAGTWRAEVRATKLGSPSGKQTYSLVITSN